ncbi:hypothetical protein [Desulfogranum japonicum]|uniref:hypothetical protein n=1 Tax=Desulfogranum japonicum TaxID=231447 RepID=UPI000423B73B|nr:hypothetical protein [Desulfogranum japonicum]
MSDNEFKGNMINIWFFIAGGIIVLGFHIYRYVYDYSFFERYPGKMYGSPFLGITLIVIGVLRLRKLKK